MRSQIEKYNQFQTLNSAIMYRQLTKPRSGIKDKFF